MQGQLRYIRGSGFHVTAICSPGPQLDAFAATEGIETCSVAMKREIAPIKDIASFFQLVRTLRKIRPQLINVSTPKAGLLGSVAGFFLRVPCRVYTLRGLRFETASGTKRALLRVLEKLVCYLSHQVICAGPGLRQRAIDLGLVRPEKAIVLASGSTNGVDIAAYEPTHERQNWAANFRRENGVALGAPVIGFVARFTRDKGLPELYYAFSSLRETFSDLRLLLIGDFEVGDPIPAPIRTEIESDSHVIRTGFVKDPAPYYHVMDLLALPTYREGFPNVVLEALAAEVPAVTTTATGAMDSVLDGVTGYVVPVADADQLRIAIEKLIADKTLRTEMGRNGRLWVTRKFSNKVVWQALIHEYSHLLNSRIVLNTVRERSWRQT